VGKKADGFRWDGGHIEVLDGRGHGENLEGFA
jgi:hypothetical protein